MFVGAELAMDTTHQIDDQNARFWARARADYERLRADPVAWAHFQAEVAMWDTVAGDGLEIEDPYYGSEEEQDLA
jgi:hypothetical protein